MSTTRDIRRLAVLISALIAFSILFARSSPCTPPTGGGNPTVAAPATKPQRGGTSTVKVNPSDSQRDERHSSFDWQGFVGGLSGSQDRRRPQPTPRPESREWPPGYHPSPLRPWQPVLPPDYGQSSTEPSYPTEYSQPTPTPTVVLKPNIVKVQVQVPIQRSPMEGRVSELGIREAQSYATELAQFINLKLTAAMEALQQGGVETNVMQRQADTVKQMLNTGSRWPDMKQALKALLEGDTSKYPPKILDDLKQIAKLIAVRDAFLVVAAGPPRPRSGPLPVGAIPVGIIWILFDPRLPTGTALMVNDTFLVVGTSGRGQFIVAEQSAAAALGLPVAVGDPVPDIGEAEAQSFTNSIIIREPRTATSEVNYALNGRQSFTIKPGQMQTLSADKQWTVEFDRGSSQGAAKYALTSGVYEFRIVNDHWDLFHLRFDITIDNREGTQDFQYVAANEVVTVKAGETKTESSAEPIIVKFDRGEGPDHATTKNLNKSGTYKVAVNTQTNMLDLYALADTGTQRTTPVN